VTVLVDAAILPFEGRKWAHLVSDTSFEELHEFAEQLGIPRRAFQGDHYDVPTEYRDRAIALGQNRCHLVNSYDDYARRDCGEPGRRLKCLRRPKGGD
jgi:hypothetical protein